MSGFGFTTDPARGLPPDVFLEISRLTPIVNVDLLIKDSEGRTLLTWRDDEYYGAGWHIPGGIIRFQESAAARVHEVARIELGAKVEFDPYPIFFHETILPERTERGHFISLLYRCTLATPPDPSLAAGDGPPSLGQWRWPRGCPADILAVHRIYGRFF